MSFRSKPRRLFVSAVILIAASGVFAALTMYALFASERWVRHSHKVQLTIARTISDLSKSGRARMAYVDSADPTALADFNAVHWDIRRDLDQLRALVMDSPDQLARATQLESVVAGRMKAMQDSIALVQSGASTRDAQAKITTQVVGFASESAGIADRMQEAESVVLETRRDLTATVFIAILVILFAILVLAVFLLRKHYHLLETELRERQAAERNAERLSGALMRAQDEERRRFSRELHDGLGQTLAGAKMVADQLGRHLRGDERAIELSAMLDQAVTETRTLSHLLHPPLLDEIGFLTAAQGFIDNFAKRTGIAVTFERPDHLPHFTGNLDLTLFRVLQEALTNVHRHAHSPRADVVLFLKNDHVTLRVRDYGVGMPAATLARLQTTGDGLGVGLAGMRERVREQGGTLSVVSDSLGTLISVCFELQSGSAAVIEADPAEERAIEQAEAERSPSAFSPSPGRS